MQGSNAATILFFIVFVDVGSVRGGTNMNAEILAVGTELLLGQIVNSNAQYLSSQLALLGINVHFQGVVGDNRKRLLEAIKIAVDRSDILLLTGGLGPTDDDLTREAVAEFFGKPLLLDDSILSNLEAFFQSRGIAMPPNNRKQAMRIEGAQILPNSRGTAPGQYLDCSGKHVFLLPGPPSEMQPMFRESVIPILRGLFPNQTIQSRLLRMVGIGESAMEEKVRDILDAQTNPTIAPYASEGECSLRITAKAENEQQAWQLIAPVEQKLRERLSKYIYGVDEETLPQVVGRQLQEKGLTLAVAESCTGGLLGKWMTDIPGSSKYFVGGCITYNNELKQLLLNVSPQTLQTHGAVSEECAMEMAIGLHGRTHADVCVSITGIAGPDGGTPEKPVGLVYTAVHYAGQTLVRRWMLHGDRNQIRIRAAKQALQLVWRVVTGTGK
jgi:nicotinamide-nucleotide amidase